MWEVTIVEGCTHEFRKVVPAQGWVSVNSLSVAANLESRVKSIQAWRLPGRDNKEIGGDAAQWTCAGPGFEPEHWGQG